MLLPTLHLFSKEMKICIAGKNNIAVDVLYHVLTLFPATDICVLTNRTDMGVSLWQKSLKQHAAINHVQELTLSEIEKIEDILFLSLEFDKIIKPQNFKTERIFNIHFSLLPEYKGVYTSLFPVLHAKAVSGVSLHVIDQGIDTGPLIDQSSFEIHDFTSRMLYEKCLNEGTKLVKLNLAKLCDKSYSFKKQTWLGSTYFDKKSFDFNCTEIPVNKTAFQIQQFIRALNFRVYQMATFNGDKLSSSKITDRLSRNRFGAILYQDNEKYIIATMDYDIELIIDKFDLLITACMNNDIVNASEALPNVIDIDETNAEGLNPAMVASRYGAVDILKLLLQRGANLLVKDQNHRTLLHYAKEYYLESNGYGALIFLLNNGCDPCAKDIFGHTILDGATDHKLQMLIKPYFVG